jgi:hypothetical protein
VKHVPCQARSLELPCLGPLQFCTIVQFCMAALQCLVPSGNAGWLEASVLEAREAPGSRGVGSSARWRGSLPRGREGRGSARGVLGSRGGIGARRPSRLRMQDPCHYVGMILVG